jgi:hypothetical protein
MFSWSGTVSIMKFELGIVAHICNPNYSDSRDQEDHSSRPVQAKSPGDPISTNIQLAILAPACHPSYAGSINKRIAVQAAQA